MVYQLRQSLEEQCRTAGPGVCVPAGMAHYSTVRLCEFLQWIASFFYIYLFFNLFFNFLFYLNMRFFVVVAVVLKYLSVVVFVLLLYYFVSFCSLVTGILCLRMAVLSWPYLYVL